MNGPSSPPRRSTVAHSGASSVSPPRSSTSIPRKPASITRHTPAFALHAHTPRHILVPTTRVWPPPNSTVRSPRQAAKLSKRHGSVDLTNSVSNTLAAVVHENAWLEHLANLNVQVIDSGVELFGYQVFAVEQWLVDRAKVVRTVTVYTGNPRDRILVTILGPVPGLASSNTEDLFQRTLGEFRKDGARPRETDRGVILITSLASFRSDLNIVQIPNGDVLACKDDLYVNVNLQRLGVSGRSGLNLDEPNDSSKEKFLQMYGISEPTPLPSSTTSKAWFQKTVLELVRTVQSALSLFGLFSLASDERDGLLCDNTMDGMQEWVARIGVEFRIESQLQSIDKALDPAAVAALLGMVISLKNKLSSLAVPQIPKDPFLDPVTFLHALPSFRRDAGGSRSSTSSHAFTSPTIHFIDWELINRVQDTYAKSRQTEPYKVHRVLKNKLEDLTTVSTSLATNLNLSLKVDGGNDTRTSHASSTSGGGHGMGLSGTSTPIHNGVRTDHFLEGPDVVDIDTFSKLVSSSSKSDVPPSVRDLFGGRPGYHRHLREQEEANKHATSSASLSARYPLGLGGQWDHDAEDNSYAGMIWRGTGGRVQRKGHALAHGIAELAGIDGKSKKRKNKHSVDGLGDMESDTSGGHHGLLPSVVITGDKSPDVTDHEERDNMSMNPYSPTPSSYRSPASSVTNLSDYDRNIRKFNNLVAPLDVVSLRALGQTHSSPTAPTLARVRAGDIVPSAFLLPGIDNVRAASTSVESVLLPDDLGLAFDFPGHGHLGYADGSVHQRWKRRFAASTGLGFTDDMGMMGDERSGRDSGAGEDDQSRRDSVEAHRTARLARRRSISDISDYTGLPVLDVQYMQTDAELAYQYMLLKEKEANMKNIAAVLEIMSMSLNGATDTLSKALAPQAEAQPSIWARYTALSDLTGQGRTEANLLKQQVKTSNYQTERLVEGSDRLDQTLEGYRKRMDDVEHAVSGLYALEPYPVQQDEKWEDEDEAVDLDKEPAEEEPLSPKAPNNSTRRGLLRWLFS